jgi:RNA polymerase sigma factor (sigma-70 family)
MELDKIVQGCKDNNPKAQAMLHKLYYTKMIRIAYKYSNGSDDVEDLVQEAFISIYKNIPRFTGKSIHQLDYWVHNIIKNKTLDLYRKNKGIIKVEMHDGLFNYDEQESFYDLFITDIPVLINSLSPQYKKVVTLYYLEEKSHLEISKILGITVSSSKTNLLRSKIKMKKTLLKLYPMI